MTTNHKYALDILQEAVTTWQHNLADPGLSRVDRAFGEAVLPDVQAAMAVLKTEQPVTDRLGWIQNMLGEIGRQLGVEREPCEDPTPAEQADYDRVLEGQEKGWNLLDHALTEDVWVLHSFVRRMDGTRVETTRTLPIRVAAVNLYNNIEAELRRDLSGGPDLVMPRDWQRAESFTLRMYAPGEPVPEREAVALCNDADAWIINTSRRGVALHSRQGMYGTPAHPIF